MANASVTHSPATKKLRKPDTARVVETYWYEVKARGQWGAYTRTAAIYRLSDETIRRYVKQSEQPLVPSVDAGLLYQPAPGERPIASRIVPHLAQKQQRTRPHCHTISHSHTMQRSGFLCKPVRSNVAKVAQFPTPTFPISERETVLIDLGKLPHSAPPKECLRTYPPRPRPRPSVDMAALVVQVFQPSPMLAVILFALLLGLLYWK